MVAFAPKVIIACLRQVVAFAPKVIKCAAYGVAIMNGRRGRGGVDEGEGKGGVRVYEAYEGGNF